ncbi:transposable element Tcb2 transposase [Trichonephila clavipes]|nr:transposable element Tcb2 transposase [Trichonephila clavipes]
MEEFHSDASLGAVDRGASNNSKNRHWTTEGDVSARRSTFSPHGSDDHTAFSWQLASRWSTATGVLMSTSSIRRRLLLRGLRARVPLYRIHLTSNHRRLDLQWAHEHRAWQADWPQVVFSHESCFDLWDHDGPLRHPWSYLSTYVAKNVKDFLSAQHMQLLPSPDYSPDMSPTENEWDLVGRRLVSDLRPTASKDELLLRIEAMWKSLPQTDIQHLFDSMACDIAALIAASSGYIKY